MTKSWTTPIPLPAYYDGLTPAARQLVRAQYIRIQNNLCYWCNQDLSTPPAQTRKINKALFPKHFFNYPIHLQHCHETGLTEGAVHAYCNAEMWQYFQR